MTYKVLVSFSGYISAPAGAVIEINNNDVVKDLLKAGYIEPVNGAEETAGVETVNDAEETAGVETVNDAEETAGVETASKTTKRRSTTKK